MLRNLHIRNLALIREVDVDFAEGLNILTGETGSGKSIIVDSIGLALGGRVQRDMVREDGKPALIELVFELSDDAAVDAVRALGIEPEDGVLVIARKLQDGRSTCRINGETKTAAEVRACAALLLEIHGQSEHQKLLRSDKQLELLDDFGRNEIAEAKEAVASEYRIYSGLRKELGGEPIPPEERARRISFLEFEIGEIDDAELEEGEDEELEKTYRRLSNSRRIAEACESAHEYTGYDGQESAGESIGRALKRLEAVAEYDERLSELNDQLSVIDGLLNDFNRDLSEYADGLSYEAQSFKETEDRLNLINRLKAKYGRSIAVILEKREEKCEELEQMRDYEQTRAKLERELAASAKRLQKVSAELTECRKRYSQDFIREASAQFADLNFARADFSIEFTELPAYTANGRDGIEFVISTNPGEERRPLRNVVSGGELSRLMLGIRTMFADLDSIETLIFDEIDTGISGRTAQKAAQKLSETSKGRQVICITHLPQIAAMADTHYGISKELSDDAAITNIEALSFEESVHELARLIGGAEITGNVLTSAREMKELCRQFRKEVL